jgi:hypothetical protein
MKKFATLSVLLLLATLILLPGTSNGKYNVSKPAVADGYPYPPIPPNPGLTNTADTLAADGYPYPPIPPNPGLTNTADTLVADAQS